MAGAAGDTLVINDIKTLKVVADPFRRDLLQLIDKPRTVKELAAEVGRPADRLYYHLSLLERHGLIAADDQRGAERRYRPAAEQVHIDPNIVIPPDVVMDLISGMLTQAGKEYNEAVRRPEPDGVRRTVLAMAHFHLTEEEREHFTAELVALTAKYENRKSKKGTRTYGVLRGIWPVAE